MELPGPILVEPEAGGSRRLGLGLFARLVAVPRFVAEALRKPAAVFAQSG